jgi:hyperosmotically inducible protein
MTTFALPMMLAATVSFASAQEAAKSEARETKQEAKSAAATSGNAIKDSWITLKVHSQFVPEDALKDSDIDVDTNNGVVMLNGTVASEAGRARAIAIAKATDGVKNVMDHLRVAKPADSTVAMRDAGKDAADKTKEAAGTTGDKARETAGTTGKAISDGWIKSKIAAQYVTESSLDNSDIDIDVSQGAVALKGAVRTEAAKDRAESIAKATDGVKGVKNDLKVDPNVK